MQGFITSIRQKNTSLETKLDFEEDDLRTLYCVLNRLMATFTLKP